MGKVGGSQLEAGVRTLKQVETVISRAQVEEAL